MKEVGEGGEMREKGLVGNDCYLKSRLVKIPAKLNTSWAITKYFDSSVSKFYRYKYTIY